ncbi:DUF2142 domain-containing protein [Dactylosporangium aurantiacum]|uniref:DUF2142 domain-containing protein n=1 Tax=Dactylosporangium aurantiacum TaxID=35754 RepID=A0A9Q9MAV0_9ACTN|nr:DUF2142 domain-containing protein [Dactylosporangium aurantiacum]MDG6101975.1 DUF2142 domain-containing protein [Dactylosporangium aurantiacum]UWZ52238.1 DUF2142 domain-containing protein [Dactylosporangium aurantiacum]
MHSGPRSWLLAFLAFFLVFGAWAVAAPFDGPADEVQHSIRAAGVGSFAPGQIFAEPRTVPDAFGRPGMGAYQRVPAGMDAHAVCWGFDPTKSAACAKGLSGGPVTEVSTSAGRYNPLFYLVVGPPLRWLPNWGGLVVARLLNAAMCAALIASAFLALRRWSRFGLPATALLCVATPMLAHLAGGVNPNALEIAAGIAFFAAGIPLLLEPPDPARKPLVTLLGVSSVLLLTLRSGGPAWFVFGLAALALPLRWAWLKQWWAHTRVKLWSAGVVVAGLLSATWIVVMRTGELVPPPPGLWDYTTGEAVTQYVDSWYQLLIGMIGVAGWFDTKLWSPFYLVWIMIVGGMVVLGGVVGGWVTRWRYLVFLAGGVVLPGILQVSQANVTGFITGGRYMLPLLAGMPLLAAWVLERRLFDAGQARTLSRTFVLFLLPVHAALLVFAMVRWQRGLAPDAGLGWFNPLAGDWHPPTGSVLPLLLMLAGLALTAVVMWRTPVAGPADPAAEPTPATLPEADPQPAAH